MNFSLSLLYSCATMCHNERQMWEETMRNPVFAALISGLILAFGSPLAARNLIDIKKPIELDAGKSPRMFVIFNHSTHTSVKCRTCHHEGLPGNRFAPCTSEPCHSLQGASNRKPLSVYMAYHARDTDRSCYGCHKSLSDKYPDFKGCQPCHLTPQGRIRAQKKTQAEGPSI